MSKSYAFLVSAVCLFIAFADSVYAEISVKDFVANMEKNDRQSVLMGDIDSMTIARGNGQFQLGKGKLTLFDFGTGRIMAMVFEGSGRFIYVPPDEVERGQLQRFIKRDTLVSEITTVVLFGVNLPADSNGFNRVPVDKGTWLRLQNIEKGLLQNFNLYMPGLTYTDMLLGKGDNYFYTDITDKTWGEFVYIANPFDDDLYSLYKVRAEGKNLVSDKISGYGIDSIIQAPIDIKKYQLDIKIGGGGKVEGSCKINYVSLENSLKCIPFRWSPRNSVKSVKDGHGKPLSFISKDGWDGFAVILNNPINREVADSITVEYSGKPFHSEWAINYCDTEYSWYPMNVVLDFASYSLAINVPAENVAISNNGPLDRESDGYIDKAIYNYFENISYLSLCYGSIMTTGIKSKLKVNSCLYMPRLKDWRNIFYFHIKDIGLNTDPLATAILNAVSEYTSILVWVDISQEEINPYLLYYNKLMGFCPSDTLYMIEAPYNHGKGVPGIAYLSTYFDSLRRTDAYYRAHEVAHLWWGNCIHPKSYRDEWITEGLAEYCAYLSFKNANPDTAKEDTILGRWRNKILSNSVNGPVILGNRLRTNVSDTTGDYLISKSAYIFHMLRFFLKDYSTNSNDQFIAFIRDLASQYRDKELSTAEFQTVLERYTRRSMRWFINQWVYGNEIPSYSFSYRADSTAEGNYQVLCKIHQGGVPDGFMMQIPVTVVYESGSMVHFPCFISESDQEISLPLIPAKPKEVLFNTFGAVLCKD